MSDYIKQGAFIVASSLVGFIVVEWAKSSGVLNRFLPRQDTTEAI